MEVTIMVLICLFLLSLCFNAMLWSTLCESREYLRSLSQECGEWQRTANKYYKRSVGMDNEA